MGVRLAGWWLVGPGVGVGEGEGVRVVEERVDGAWLAIVAQRQRRRSGQLWNGAAVLAGHRAVERRVLLGVSATEVGGKDDRLVHQRRRATSAGAGLRWRVLSTEQRRDVHPSRRHPLVVVVVVVDLDDKR